ncbi:hypothetical protein [Bacteriovorax sp. DB6_IX]|uniref:hypothetical protein n=1 Tax=Bacteriovorax sp. DB6_IX TaxID=1353530 RepID=UPI00038A1242|nr:hypothetical protein [Bacteriovorax sp. DB6_IX]EQC51689.1 hypothetical protein M901_2862 [Bacteriovorax sp. DB6_IX]
MKIFLILFLLFTHVMVSADEACSRIAIINQQEVLIDPSSTRKGEGLTYHLQKDQKAYEYLKKYQSSSEDKWRPAIIGSIGTGLILTAFISNADDKNRKGLLIAGASTLLVNFLITKTIESSNEQYLYKAIEEYNKRNLPKIFLKTDEQGQVTPGAYLEKSWSF